MNVSSKFPPHTLYFDSIICVHMIEENRTIFPVQLSVELQVDSPAILSAKYPCVRCSGALYLQRFGGGLAYGSLKIMSSEAFNYQPCVMQNWACYLWKRSPVERGIHMPLDDLFEHKS